jgi:hypothetical protein
MEEYRDQVISPVMTEEGHFSTPMGTRGGAAPGREFGSSPFGGTAMEDASSGPSRPDGGSNLQFALLSLGRQLSGPPRPGLENSFPLGAPQATSGGGRSGVGKRRVPHGTEGPNICAGPKGKKGSGDLKLNRNDLQDRHRICGGIISRRGGGANRFCVATNCGFAHDKKVFNRLEDGAYYIVELGGGRGAGSSQQPRALLDPSLPKAAAEYSEDNHEVLAAENSMQGWLSLFRFRYLVEAEEQGDVRAPNPALTEFAARARASAFTTPLRDTTKRARDDEEEASEGSRSPRARPLDLTAL